MKLLIFHVFIRHGLNGFRIILNLKKLGKYFVLKLV